MMTRYAVGIVLLFVMFAWAGCKKDSTRFFPIKPSAGDTVALRGIAARERADSAWNSVFLDMSKEVQSPVLRSSWDLGFYCGTDDFRVIINSSLGATAYELAATNLNDVVDADTAALTNILLLNDTQGTLTTVDQVGGDRAAYLAGTVIKSISANNADNKVYIIKRGVNTNLRFSKWIKVKITRTNNGYSMTYGNISDNNNLYTTQNILKDASYNFKYASFSSRVSDYEPGKELWDFCWGYNTNRVQNPDGTFRAQTQPDFININFMAGVTAAEVIFGADTTKNYRNFRVEDLDGITFSGSRDIIGGNWRRLEEANIGILPIRTDRFYLLKDPKGNVYKMSFAGGGSRASPIVSYILLRDEESDQGQ